MKAQLRLVGILAAAMAVLLNFGAAQAQCPNPNNNFQHFAAPNMTPTGVGDTVVSHTFWGGDFTTVNVDSGKTYWISLCETGYVASMGFNTPDDTINFDPQLTLYQDTANPSSIDGPIVGYSNDACGPLGIMPEITYTASFTGELAVAVDPYNPAQANNACDSFAIDSAIVQIAEIMAPSMSSCDTVQSGFQATMITSSTARLLWDTVAGADMYRVWYKPVGSMGWTKLPKNANQGRKDITGLMAGTTYRWLVQARCGGNWGTLSDPQFFGTLPGSCGMPMATFTNAGQPNKARFNWTKSADAFKYEIRWQVFGDTTWNYITKDSTWSKHWLTGLSSATMYQWQIRSVCKSGPTLHNSSWTNVESFTTVGPKTELPGSAATSQNRMIRVLPNPNNGAFMLDLRQLEGNVVVAVYDMTGRLVERIQTTGDRGLDMDLTKFGKGVYSVQVESNDFSDHQRVVVR